MRGGWAGQVACVVFVTAAILLTGNHAGRASATKRIYVAVDDSYGRPYDRIYVYDPTTLLVVDTILTPDLLVSDIQVSPSGHRLYVAGYGRGYVNGLYAIDPSTRSFIWSFPDTALDEYPFSFLHENGKWLMFGRSIVDAETGGLIKRLPDSVLPFDGPAAGSKILAGIPDDGVWHLDTLRILDIASGAVSGGFMPRLSNDTRLATQWAILLPDTTRAIVVGFVEQSVIAWAVISEVATGAPLLEIPLQFISTLPALNPDGTRALVMDQGECCRGIPNATLDVVDLVNPCVIRHFDFGPSPANYYGECAFDHGGARALLANWCGGFCGGGDFTVFDMSLLEFGSKINIPHSGPYAATLGAIGIGDSCECCCPCLGDPTCDHVVNDLRDVVLTINVALRGSAAPNDLNPNCALIPTDMDCTGQTDILDVVRVIDVAFRGIPPVRACEPCVP